MAIELIDWARGQGARESLACDVLGLTCRTLRRWRERLQASGSLQDRRSIGGPVDGLGHALTEAQRQQILDVCNSSEFQSLPPSQIVPILADRGIYLASESSFYRVLRRADQTNRRGKANRPAHVARPKAWKATKPNQVWSWDITFLPTLVKGEFLRLYMITDIYSRKIVGWEVHREESAQHAAVLIQKACLAHGVQKDQLVLHSDNGSPMKGATMLSTLQRLGIMPSFSRPSVSDDNPYSESLFRTLKYDPKYPRKPFESIDTARQWVLGFAHWYNNTHRHSGIKFVTPIQRHEAHDSALLAKRDEVYEQAKANYPQRWRNRPTRNWSHVGAVWLNPDKENQRSGHLRMAA